MGDDAAVPVQCLKCRYMLTEKDDAVCRNENLFVKKCTWHGATQKLELVAPLCSIVNSGNECPWYRRRWFLALTACKRC